MTHEELRTNVEVILDRYYHDDDYAIEDAESALLQLINRIGEEATTVDHPEGNATERGKGFYEGLDTVRQRLSLLTGNTLSTKTEGK